MCRAHGIAHQRVTEPGALRGALAAAWGLNRHSVVEVATARRANVAHHRAVQAAVGAAVLRALRLATAPSAGNAACCVLRVKGGAVLHGLRPATAPSAG
jgi:hypothetical protein